MEFVPSWAAAVGLTLFASFILWAVITLVRLGEQDDTFTGYFRSLHA